MKKKSLAESHPELAAEADGWDPAAFSMGSEKRVGWKCEKGHTWTTLVFQRARMGTGCPFCSNQRVWPGFNDLKTRNPELAREANGWDPESVLAGGTKKFEWKCKAGHVWTASMVNRVSKGTGCPYCSGRRAHKGESDLLTTDPEVARQAHGWDPTTLGAGSHEVREWVCAKGHVWKARVFSRTKAKSSCPYCAKASLLQGFNDITTLFPEIAAEAYGWDPSQVLAGSTLRREWQCSSGHVWTTTISSRTSKGTGCPYCSNQKVLAGFNDLASRKPDLAAEADGWDPSTVLYSAVARKKWKCAIGHSWEGQVAQRFRGGPCPFCSRQKVLAGFNDLGTTHPALAQEACGWDPSKFLSGSAKKMNWQCVNRHQWTATIIDRATKGAKCPFCTNHFVKVGFNDLSTTHPELATQADGWDPTTVMAGTTKSLPWKCDKGHHWQTSPSNRAAGSGCPGCAKYGFDPNAQGFVYLMHHEAWQLMQIGITNDVERRISEHAKHGWELVDLIGPMSGSAARVLEQGILREIRTSGVKTGPQATPERFSGFTESWSLGDLSSSSLKALTEGYLSGTV